MMSNNVSVPRSYFLKTAERDYTEPRQALIREFLQNSRDAKASQIHFDFAQKDDKIILTVTDDGCGMDKDIIVNKLMALGETTKGEQHTGGFGVAKILLFFAHDSYTIETKNLIVRGSGGSYAIDTTSNYIKGVKASIVMAQEVVGGYSLDRLVDLCRKEIKKSFLPSLKIFVQNEQIEANLKKGRAVEEIAKGMTLHKKVTEDVKHYAYIRVNGLHMFEQYVGEVKFKLIVELDGYSTEYLTTNRDGLRSNYREKIAKLCREFELNSMRGSKSSVRLFTGHASRFSEDAKEIENVVTDINNQISALIASTDTAYLDSKINHIFETAKQEATPEVRNTLDELQAATRNKINNIEVGTTWIPLTVKDLDLAHHYFVETRGNFRTLPAKWEPQNFRQSQTMVLELWSKVLSMVLADSDQPNQEFNVGFILDDGSEGGVVLANFRTRHDSSYLFLVNPQAYGTEGRLPIKRDRRSELIMWLLDLAVHEVTHSNGYSHHNESFMGAEIELKRRCNQRIKEYLKL